MLKTHHWDGEEKKNQHPAGFEPTASWLWGKYYTCCVTIAASRFAPPRGTRMKDSALIWRGINKAKHPAGFEPTTSWLWGMCSTLVQQLLPRPQVQYNFLWSSQERKGEEKKIFTLIRFSTLRLNFQGQLRLQLIFISWVNIFNFKISETRDIINRWSRLGRLLSSEITTRCNWLLLKVIRILSANFAKQIHPHQHWNSGA